MEDAEEEKQEKADMDTETHMYIDPVNAFWYVICNSLEINLTAAPCWGSVYKGPASPGLESLYFFFLDRDYDQHYPHVGNASL